MKAEASPMMLITPNYPTASDPAGSYSSVGDWDPSHTGDERLFMYTVRNVSAPGVQNNMINWFVNVGTNQGLYLDGIINPDDSIWSVALEPDRITFNGLLSPGDPQIQFGFLTGSTGLGTGYASATATGIGYPVPFNDVQVNVPTPEPATGDLSGDECVDLNDLPLFINTMLDDGYVPPAGRAAADMNADGVIDGRDVQRFVDALLR